MKDQEYMRLAIRLAQKGWGYTSPNPMVGAVLVKGEKIVGKGAHLYCGGDHAEVAAIKDAGAEAKGATLYVTLEPCCHLEKRTPPCTEAIISAGIKKVIVSTLDPNPYVSGKGIKRLEDANIHCEVGLLEKSAKQLNEAYFKFMQTNIPFVTLKLGMSLDGKIATKNYESKWITSEKSRQFVQYLRLGADAIIVGANTVKIDNPELSIRIKRRKKIPKKLLRVIVSGKLDIPLQARVFHSKINKNGYFELHTLVATTNRAPEEKITEFKNAGVEVLILPEEEEGRVSLKELIAKLGERKIVSVLIEGGSELAWSALRSQVVDKIIFFYAPKIIGGRESIVAVGGAGISKLEEAIELTEVTVSRIRSSPDFIVVGYIKK